MRKIIFQGPLLLSAILLLLVACPGSSSDPSQPPSAAGKFSRFDAAILEGYTSVDTLRDDLELVASTYLKSVIEYYAGVLADPAYTAAGGVDDDAAETAGDSSSQGDDKSADDYGTNNQIAGVDEADVVKSDGTYIYLSCNSGDYYGIDVVPVRNRTSRTAGYPDEAAGVIIVYDTAGNLIDKESSTQRRYSDILLSDDMLIAFSSRDYYDEKGGSYNCESVIDLFDLKSGELTLKKTIELPGQSLYVTARKIGDCIHVIHSADLAAWSLYDKISPWSGGYPSVLSAEEYRVAAASKIDTLAKEWADSVIESYFYNSEGVPDTALLAKTIKIASLIDSGDDETAEGAYRIFPDPLVTRLLFVSSLSLDDASLTLSSAASFCTDWGYDNVYADSGYVVVAHSGYRWNSSEDITSMTFLSAFSIDGASVVPSAAGSVEGYLLNQFSMDRQDNYLRVASATPAKWSYNADEGTFDEQTLSENQVTILDLSASQMSEKGKIGSLGIDEQIYAVRFCGDIGIVVTFKQTDPFYTLDLSDPAKPRKAGELKIPGFSNYLHPIDEDYVIGIGEENGSFKVALYDIRDLENPQQVSSVIESGWSSSEANYDHHAFRYVASKKTLVLPLSYWNYTEQGGGFNGFVLYGLDLTAETPALTRNKEITLGMDDEWYYMYNPSRSMLIDNNYIFIKSNAIASYNSDSFAKNWEKKLE